MKLHRIGKKYGKKVVLDIRDFSFEQKGIYAVLGVNGAGKTTLFRTITELVPSVLEIDKKRISYFADDEQYFRGSIKHTIDIVESTFDDFNQERASEIIGIFQLKEKDKIKSLSRGQKVLLSIALTISRDSDIYFFDELFSNIDFELREIITKVLVTNLDVMNKQIIISSHEIDDVERLADYVTVLHQGILSAPLSLQHILEKHQDILSYFKFVVEGGM